MRRAAAPVLMGLLALLLPGCERHEPTGATPGAASEKAVDLNSLEGTRKLLATRSPGCLKCAQAKCPQLLDKCTQMEGVAASGPAKGKSKRELCLNTMDCLLRSKCAAGDRTHECYCGTSKGADCLSPGPDGPNGLCKRAIEEGLETTVPIEISNNFSAPELGGGPSVELIACLSAAKCKACF